MNFKIKSLDYEFRIKKMNVVEVLAIRANLANDTIADTINLFNELLERVEVNFEGAWIPVKIKGLSALTPVVLESDINAVKEIIDFFIMEYLKKVFTKSNESNN